MVNTLPLLTLLLSVDASLNCAHLSVTQCLWFLKPVTTPAPIRRAPAIAPSTVALPDSVCNSSLSVPRPHQRLSNITSIDFMKPCSTFKNSWAQGHLLSPLPLTKSVAVSTASSAGYRPGATGPRVTTVPEGHVPFLTGQVRMTPQCPLLHRPAPHPLPRHCWG